MAVRCGRGKLVGLGHWPPPYQPIYEGFVGVGGRMRRAAQTATAGCQSENVIAEAAGPQTFTFEELLPLLASGVPARVRQVHTMASLGFAFSRLVDMMLRDVVLSRDEVDGLMAGLLTSDGTPAGTSRLSAWLKDNAGGQGKRYVSELQRNYRT